MTGVQSGTLRLLAVASVKEGWYLLWCVWIRGRKYYSPLSLTLLSVFASNTRQQAGDAAMAREATTSCQLAGKDRNPDLPSRNHVSSPGVISMG